jgi:glutamate carboxypeptidase
MTSASLLSALRARTPAMLAALEALVAAESPSSDLQAVARCAEQAASLGERLLGESPEVLTVDGHVHLRWEFGRPRVLVLGHFDTVWPLDTLGRWPFGVRDGVATGPGVFDMKAGVVQALFALAALPSLDGVTLLLTGDEELGSPTSRPLIERTAKGLAATLVCEPAAPGGALKIGRKGVSIYCLTVEGRASHAGLEPGRGANALLELAYQLLALAALSRPQRGTTVTPTVAVAGTATNVVPARARCEVDVRSATGAEQERVDREVHALQPVVAGTQLEVSGGPNRPPMEAASAGPLLARAVDLGAGLGLGQLSGAVVGGASDGNFTAGVGTPTLDGLGPVGDGAHAEGEHVLVAAMPERAALLAALVRDLLRA